MRIKSRSPIVTSTKKYLAWHRTTTWTWSSSRITAQTGSATTETSPFQGIYLRETTSLGLSLTICYKNKLSKCLHLTFRKINWRQAPLMLGINFQLHLNPKILASSKHSLSLSKQTTSKLAKRRTCPCICFTTSSIEAKESNRLLN